MGPNFVGPEMCMFKRYMHNVQGKMSSKAHASAYAASASLSISPTALTESVTISHKVIKEHNSLKAA